MSKISSLNIKGGSFIDTVTGESAIKVGGDFGFKKYSNGMMLSNGGAYGSLVKIKNSGGLTNTGDFSVFIPVLTREFKTSSFINKFSASATGRAICTSGANYYLLYYTTGGVLKIVNYDIGNITNKKFYLGIVYKDGVFYLYKNNELTATSASPLITNNNEIVLFSYQNDNFGNTLNGAVGTPEIYNEAIDVNERNRLYKSFLNSYGTEKQKRNFVYPKPTDLSKEVDSVVGEDIIGGIDLTDGWDVVNGIIDNANKFTTTANGGVSKGYVEVGKKYRCHISGTTTASSFMVTIPSVSTNYSGALTGTFDTSFDFTPGINTLYLRNVGSGATTITDFTITEVTGLVAAYNMIPSNGKLIDISGNGNNGTISGALSTKDGMKLETITDRIVLNSEANINQSTIQFNIDLKNITATSSLYGQLSFNVSGYRILFSSAGGMFIQIHRSGANTSTFLQTLSLNQSHTITLAIDNTNSKIYSTVDGLTQEFSITPFDINGLNSIVFGSNAGSPAVPVSIKDHRRYNYLVSNEDAVAYHNSFIKPTLLEDFSDYAVGDTL